MVVTDADPLGTAQLVLSTFEQFAVGFVVLLTKVTEQVLVHDVLVLVTVTVYVPATKLLMVAVVAPVLHK